MPPVATRPSSRRLLALAAGGLLLAFMLFVQYSHLSDTATLLIVAQGVHAPIATDSSTYMNMGEDAFRAGDRIYPKVFFEEHQKFIYPPSSLFLIEALNLAPSPLKAREILLWLSWLGTLVVSVVFFGQRRGSITGLEAASVVLLGVLFLPIAEAIYRGQVQSLLIFLWGLSAVLWQRERRGWAGFFLALTCAFKPQLAIFLLWGALRKEWRFTATFAATAAAILACSVAHFGLQNNLDYLPVLNYLSHHGEALWANQSMNGLLNRLLRNADSTTWSLTDYAPYRASIYILSTAFSVLCIVAGLALPHLKKWAGTTADFLFFGGVAVVISPIAWEHHYGTFFFLLLFLLARAESLARARWYLLAACTLVMANRLPPLDHLREGLAAFWGSYLFFAGLAVLALVALEAQKPEPGSDTLLY